MPKITKDKIKNVVHKHLIDEISIGRFKEKHLKEPVGFAVVTANRHEQSTTENKERYQQIRSDYKNAGYRYIPLVGSYVETVRNPETGEETGKQRVIEDTIFVPNRPFKEEAVDLFELTKELAQKYNQEAFIYRSSGETDIKSYEADGTETDWGGPWTDIRSVGKDSDFWSRLRKGSGREETWELVEMKLKENPKSWIEAMKRKNLGETW